MEVQLLASSNGMEVVRHVLEPRARWGLVPDPQGSALECVVVESGTLRWFRPGGDRMLGPGDCLVGNPVSETCLFRAETRVSLLYATSRPVFESYVQESARIMELAVQVEQKDGYTADHCRRIMTYSMDVGRRLGLGADRLWALHYGAFLHDIGKVTLPDTILNKPGPLSPAEWELVRRHPEAGREMVESTSLRAAGPIIEQHHERYDGSGYPRGLRGDQILIEAHIVAVVDSFDAMTTDRPYRRAKPAEQALQELRRESGIRYHPDVVRAFVQVFTGQG